MNGGAERLVDCSVTKQMREESRFEIFRDTFTVVTSGAYRDA